MIEFILNNKLIRTDEPQGAVLLDFIRKNEKLYGTKIGCREGDCGACTVLVGALADDKVQYEPVVSCLTPLGNIAGKHVVTVEGLNGDDLSPVQKAFVEENATQCGFCTPGFVVSLTGFSLSGKKTRAAAISSVAGNICRCTGYKSIERAVSVIVKELKEKSSINSMHWLVGHKFIPPYFLEIPKRLKSLTLFDEEDGTKTIIAGGTDVLVQNADEFIKRKLHFIKNEKKPLISVKNNKCIIDANCSVTDLMRSTDLHDIFPDMRKYLKLVSSEQIRNMATIAGNFVNASPIGDLSIMFLVLDAELSISKNSKKRILPFKNFFTGYKQVELDDGEIIKSLSFNIPPKGFKYHFEKVSKRIHLDIASVNTAIYLVVDDKNTINDIRISAGGVAAVPLLLQKTSAFLKGRELTDENLKEASKVLLSEVSPISDIRGSSDYKKLLLRQLFYQHFNGIHEL